MTYTEFIETNNPMYKCYATYIDRTGKELIGLILTEPTEAIPNTYYIYVDNSVSRVNIDTISKIEITSTDWTTPPTIKLTKVI